MAQDLASYDPALVHGYRLTLPALEKQIDRLRASTQSEREAMAGLDPRRADVILGGPSSFSKSRNESGAPRFWLVIAASAGGCSTKSSDLVERSLSTY